MKLKSTDYPPGSRVRLQLEKAEAAASALRETSRPDQQLKKSRQHPEEDLQRQIVTESDMWPMSALLDPTAGWSAAVRYTTLGDWLYHVPNGGARNRIEAAIFAGLGVRAGVSDLVLWLPVRSVKPYQGADDFDYPGKHYVPWSYAGIYAELKAGSNSLTEKQRDFQQRADLVGFEVATVTSIHEWRALIENYFHKARPINDPS